MKIKILDLFRIISEINKHHQKMDEAKLSLRQFVREKLNVVNNYKSGQELSEALTALSSLLPRGSEGPQLTVPGVKEKGIKQLFNQNHYNQVCSRLDC